MMAMSKLVLVIESDADIRELYEVILTEEGYDVILYSSTGEAGARTALEFRKPDLVIVDPICSYQKTDVEFFKDIHQLYLVRAIPVLICTSLVQWRQKWQKEATARNCGMLTKPFNLDELLAMIQGLMDSARKVDLERHHRREKRRLCKS